MLHVLLIVYVQLHNIAFVTSQDYNSITNDNSNNRKCSPVVKVYSGCCSNAMEERTPTDCQDVAAASETTQSGVFTIFPKGTSGFPVWCEFSQSPDDDGWTVIQRRVSYSDFFKDWNVYQTGFGDLETNFWLGNQQIHSITAQGWYELRINMIGPAHEIRHAQYDVFSIGDSSSKYKLHVGKYSGDAGDSLSFANGAMFSTKDQDNDVWQDKNCAVANTGAWWYTACHLSNLNGQYGNYAYGKGINWKSLTNFNSSLKRVEMKIRRWSKRYKTM